MTLRLNAAHNARQPVRQFAIHGLPFEVQQFANPIRVNPRASTSRLSGTVIIPSSLSNRSVK
jgi:hypothetical protein